MSSEIRELVVISGKGGTGKTSITASFAVLAQGEAILADCDVDAADLHLVLVPEIIQTTDFISGREAIIRNDVCTSCGLCEELCRFDSVTHKTDEVGRVIYTIEPTACEGCGVCVRFCPQKRLIFPIVFAESGWFRIHVAARWCMQGLLLEERTLANSFRLSEVKPVSWQRRVTIP